MNVRLSVANQKTRINKAAERVGYWLKDLGFLFPDNFHAVHMPLKAG